MRKDKKLKIRTATMDDLEMIAAVEAECFPAAEAATKEEFAKRLQHYSDHFWLMFEGEKLIAFVDGFVTDEADLTDCVCQAWLGNIKTICGFGNCSCFSNSYDVF